MKSSHLKIYPIFIISCLGVLVYSNTFSSTFHFDDFTYIVGNTRLQNINDLQGIWNYYPCRFITFLSLALNYHFDHLNVLGYHLFNMAVHIASAIMVWWLILLTFSTPAMKKERISQHADILALFAGLVFVSHPVQTEAVNYICQRAASMATFFYLASLCLYIKSRPPQPPVLRGFSLVMAFLAMFTKETAVTLPLMIILYEIYFFETRKNLNWKRLLPFLLTLLLIPLTMLLTKSKFFHEIRDIAQGPGGISPIHYLLTQFRVIVTYIRLLFLPYHQHLDYDYPIFKNILELPVLFSFLFLISILWWAKRLFLKYRLLSFSIIWFFLTLLPESSLLPEKDVIFEHRLYLPMAGFSIFLVSSIYYLLKKNSLKTLIISLSFIIMCYAVLTYQRNKVWKNEFTLWNESVQLSPNKARPYMSRGSEYLQQGKLAEAIIDYDKALKLNPRYIDVYVDRADIFERQGDISQAINYLNKAIGINPNREETYFNRGKYYAEQGNFDQAIADFNRAVEINPNRPQTFSNRGDSYVQQGRYPQAILDYTKAIELDPAYAEAYNNRGAIYARQGKLNEAIIDLNKAIQMNPNYKEAFNNLTVAYAAQKIAGTDNANAFERGTADFKQDNFIKAISDFTDAIKENFKFAQAYNDRGLAYYNLNKYAEAIADYNKAIELTPNYADAYYNRGLAYDRQDNPVQTIADFNKAIGIKPDYGEVFSNRAVVYYQLKEYDKAKADVREAEKLGAIVNPQLIDSLK